MEGEDKDEVLKRITAFISEGNGRLKQIEITQAVTLEEVKGMKKWEEERFKTIDDCLKDHKELIEKNRDQIEGVSKELSYLKGWNAVVTLMIGIVIALATYIIYHINP